MNNAHSSSSAHAEHGCDQNLDLLTVASTSDTLSPPGIHLVATTDPKQTP